MLNKQETMRTLVRENVRGGVGTIDTRYLLEKADALGKCDLCARMVFAPGASIGEHPHDPDAEIYYCLTGQFTVTDNGVKKLLNPGDLMWTSKGEVHDIANLTDKPAEMLAIVLP